MKMIFALMLLASSFTFAQPSGSRAFSDGSMTTKDGYQYESKPTTFYRIIDYVYIDAPASGQEGPAPIKITFSDDMKSEFTFYVTAINNGPAGSPYRYILSQKVFWFLPPGKTLKVTVPTVAPYKVYFSGYEYRQQIGQKTK